jgi:hypothetical protein
MAVPSLDRRMIVVCSAAVLVAVFGGVIALGADPTVHRSVRTTVRPAPAVSVDAFGCPRGRQCHTRIGPPTLLSAARAALPAGKVTYALEEVDVHTSTVYRIVLTLSARRTSVHVNSQCLPRAAAVIGVPLAVSGVAGTTLTPISIDDPTPHGLKDWSITLPSSRSSAAISCGIDVRAESALDHGIDGRAIDTVVNLLADDPRLMATP